MLFFWRKHDKSINNYFSLLISCVILASVLASAFYFYGVTERLIKLSSTEKSLYDTSVLSMVYTSVKSDLQLGSFDKIVNLSDNLIQNQLISYVAIYDNEKKCYVWSTIDKLAGTKEKFSNLFGIFNLTGSIQKYKINKEENADIGGYHIQVGFESDPAMATYINTTIKNNQILAILFIFMGFISAILMSQLISKPIEKLAQGAEILSNGNLKYKIDKTEFKEINKLVGAFNEMGEKLELSYSLLEQKVKDRTQELEKANEEIKAAQAMMVHSEKMRSLGELVAGITHEINNPINFIYGNLTHLKEYTSNLLSIIDKYAQAEDNMSEEFKKEIEDLKEELDLEFIRDDFPDLIRSCQDGAERTKNIIIDLKNFSRAEELVVNDIDVHKEIETTLNILHNKLKNNVTLHKEFGDLPTIESYGGQINQVFMNILDNSAYATKDGGDIWIRTKKEDNDVIIEFEDNGFGISNENLGRIFEPFFTTKTVGEGTGLGMSISYKVIRNHNGEIDIQSELDKGTKITIKLPISGLRATLCTNNSETETVQDSK